MQSPGTATKLSSPGGPHIIPRVWGDASKKRSRMRASVTWPFVKGQFSGGLASTYHTLRVPSQLCFGQWFAVVWSGARKNRACEKANELGTLGKHAAAHTTRAQHRVYSLEAVGILLGIGIQPVFYQNVIKALQVDKRV
eukprot:1155769-Pelagomonas_calceolata.AAC.2